MGTPMILYSLPVMVLGLIPIIGIEAWVLRRGLRTPGWKSPVKVSVVANLVTTFLGVPITWFVLFLLGIAFVSILAAAPTIISLGQGLEWLGYIPWLPPGSDTHQWWIPAAHLILLIPFFLASWLIEFPIARWMLRDIPMACINRSVLLANLVSYSLLAAVGMYNLIVAIHRYGSR
jgi:hypothetical protein